jgi:hypothetical protein
MMCSKSSSVTHIGQSKKSRVYEIRSTQASPSRKNLGRLNGSRKSEAQGHTVLWRFPVVERRNGKGIRCTTNDGSYLGVGSGGV